MHVQTNNDTEAPANKQNANILNDFPFIKTFWKVH